MAISTNTLPDLLAQWRALDAAFPGFDDPALEAHWNERMDLLECAIRRARPLSVECVASALAFAQEHSEHALSPTLLRHCAQLLRAA
jgi:hypothetical protein